MTIHILEYEEHNQCNRNNWSVSLTLTIFKYNNSFSNGDQPYLHQQNS